MEKRPIAKSHDEYIKGQAKEIQPLLQQLREIIKAAAPLAEEGISYGMPAFKQNGPIAYYAGYKNHIGFYPTGTGISAFEGELGKYKYSKGAIQFPLDKPLPKTLISKIVKYKVKENLLR